MTLTARLHGVGDLRIYQETLPTSSAEGWARIAVTSVGVCGSDLHWFTDGGIGGVRLNQSVVPGHGFAAVALDGPPALTRIILPISEPALVTLGLIAFLASWNEFVWAVFVLFSPERLTLPVGLATLQAAYNIDYPVVMAGRDRRRPAGPDLVHLRLEVRDRRRRHQRPQGLTPFHPDVRPGHKPGRQLCRS